MQRTLVVSDGISNESDGISNELIILRGLVMVMMM